MWKLLSNENFVEGIACLVSAPVAFAVSVILAFCCHHLLTPCTYGPDCDLSAFFTGAAALGFGVASFVLFIIGMNEAVVAFAKSRLPTGRKS